MLVSVCDRVAQPSRSCMVSTRLACWYVLSIGVRGPGVERVCVSQSRLTPADSAVHG